MITNMVQVDLGKLHPILLRLENAHQDMYAALRVHKMAEEDKTLIAKVNVPHLLDILDDRASAAADICLDEFNALLDVINPAQTLGGEDWSKDV